MKYLRTPHPVLETWLLVVSLLLALAAGGASVVRANVTLVEFSAAAQADTITVRWVTATEIGTIGFRLYRSDQENPQDWGNPIYDTRSLGDSVTGATYTYVDGVDGNVGNVQANVRYYYLLEELTSSSSTKYGPVNAGIGLGTVATSTATATSTTAVTVGTPTATITSIIVGTATRTPTPVPTRGPTDAPAPTATRQFPNTATPIPTATLNMGSAFNSGLPTPLPFATARPTALGPANVTSPTPVGGIPLVQATFPPPPDSLPTDTPTVMLVALEVTATPTPTALTAQLNPATSSTPILRAQAKITQTPQVFEPSSSASRRATPAAASETRNATVPLVVGGGTVLLAALLGAGAFVFWQRRH